MKIQEVDHRADGDAVDDVADRAADDQREGQGQRAFVLDWDAEAPCRPVVVPMKDPKDGMPPNADGHDAPAESIDLRVRPDLLIVEQDGQDVAADNFEFAYRKALLDARSRSDA